MNSKKINLVIGNRLDLETLWARVKDVRTVMVEIMGVDKVP